LVPFSTSGFEGPLFAGFRLPASFRPQGLVTLSTVYSLRNPCRFCFAPAALLGFALRSFLLAIGIRPVSRPEEPTYRFARLYTFASEDARAGLTSRGSWALTQPASPWRPSVCLAHRPLVAPLGLTLPRSPAKVLIEISPDLLSRALPDGLTPTCRRPRVSIDSRFASSAQRQAAGVG
jgi:hypothetical protein